MTREEAKEILTHNWTRVDNPNYSESELDEAFFMAIEALQKLEDGCVPYEDYKKLLYSRPTYDSDLISRADAIEAVRKELVCDGRHETHDKTCRFIADVLLSALPSAERVGEWIRKEKEYNDCDGHRAYYWYECSECGAKPPKNQWKNEWHSPYCPSCGARMENTK